MSPFDDPAVIERFAELVVSFGANVQEGQVVAISSEPGKEALTAAIVGAAYRAGAVYVEVVVNDLRVKRQRLLHASEAALDYEPAWVGRHIEELGDLHAARIALSGPAFPGLLDDVDPTRAGRDLPPGRAASVKVVNDSTTNWTIVPCPTRNWAEYVFGDLDPEAAWERLGREVVHVCRLDEEDPVASWGERRDVLVGVAERLTAERLSAVRFRGPGTDLTVGVVPSARWIAASFDTVDGIRHMPNLPSEEIFTAPDPLRVDGVVRATKPLVVGGSVVDGLEVEFRDGRAVRIDAERGADVLRGYAAKDEGAARLGEVALVDGDGRIGPLGTTFFDTLLDENAASHIALGNAYAFTAGEEDAGRINASQIHVDFMIGGPEVDVDAVLGSGEEVPLLRGGAWQR